MEIFRTRERRWEFFLKSFSENRETEEKSKTHGRTTLEYAHTYKKNEEKWTLSGDSEDCLRIMSQPFLLFETSPKLLFYMYPRSARIPYMFVNAREIIPWCLQVLPRPGVAVVQYFTNLCRCKSNEYTLFRPLFINNFVYRYKWWKGKYFNYPSHEWDFYLSGASV